MEQDYILRISPAKSGLFSATKLEAIISEPDGRVILNFDEDTPIELVRGITNTITFYHHILECGRSIHFAEPKRDTDARTVDDELGELKPILFNYLALYNSTR
ncbi:hypothetical protein EXS72_00260 [Candidatus Pacearchaeota archaeon]|nr:hypothetical protein [Candidatus Pacearchaeota archaeon]